MRLANSIGEADTPMPISNSDPDQKEKRSNSKWRLDQAFLQGHIGAPTYLRSLFIDGWKPDEANIELRLLEAEKHRSGKMRDHSVT
jgi:hypothetical protein